MLHASSFIELGDAYVGPHDDDDLRRVLGGDVWTDRPVFGADAGAAAPGREFPMSFIAALGAIVALLLLVYLVCALLKPEWFQ